MNEITTTQSIFQIEKKCSKSAKVEKNCHNTSHIKKTHQPSHNLQKQHTKGEKNTGYGIDVHATLLSDIISFYNSQLATTPVIGSLV